jgi:prepilin-type processing-associated H-X9-DG protein
MNAACSVPSDSTVTYGAKSLGAVKSPAKFIQLAEAPGTGNHSTSPLKESPYPPLNSANERYGESDLTTETGTTNQADGQVYGRSDGTLDYTPHADAVPINRVHDAGKLIGKVYFPGRHGGGNCFLFLDSHVSYFKAWQPASMTFDFRQQ